MSEGLDNKSSLQKNNTFTKGMVKDFNDLFVGEGLWMHARNAVNNSHLGEVGVLGNEQANRYCTTAPYTVIGLIHKSGNEWVVFSTNNTDSEIGIFDEGLCKYTKVVNDKCLSFKITNLITGAAKENFDCTHSVYWQDGLNPDRYINLDNVPYKKTGVNLSPDPLCYIPEYSDELDCEKTLLQSIVETPCIRISKGKGAGQLLNGSYQAVIAYSVNGVRVTDYFKPSNVQSLWSHSGIGGSIEIDIDEIDTTFDEFELVMVTTVNLQTVARRIGYYNTRQKKIVLDLIDQAWVTIPLSYIPLQNALYYKSDKIFEINGYLLRSGVTTRPDFNYQPLANQIQSRWVSVEYPSNYYIRGGNKTSYMRDEVYSFFIRWIYKTGHRSASYHIPGRAPLATDTQIATGNDVLPGETRNWQVYNTATKTATTGTLADGGILTFTGQMGYWESTERYPDDKPDIWGNLCGKPIRHHKFPDNVTTHIHSNNGSKISVLGVEFLNIQHPLDLDGKPIEDIVGYEILRGSREGNRSIVAKGLFNNMWEYEIDGQPGKKGLYQNFPYNDLNPNVFLRTQLKKDNGNKPDHTSLVPSSYRKDIYSFHSPDTTFNKPFFSQGSVEMYTVEHGSVEGKFEFPYKHPKSKLITDGAFIFATIVGAGIAVLAALGKATNRTDISATFLGAGAIKISQAESGTATAIPDVISMLVARPAGTAAGIALAIPALIYYGALGIQSSLEAIYAFSPFRDYALQINSHGFYNNAIPITNKGNRRRAVTDNSGRYIDPFVQGYVDNLKINNLFRNKFVAVQLSSQLLDPHINVGNNSIKDNSRVRIHDLEKHDDPTNGIYTRNTCAYYGAIKLSYENQYGQLDSIVQLPIESCIFKTQPGPIRYRTGALFGGDVYINRYTEKNPYMFFNQWLLGENNGTEYNYKNYINGPFPRYWANLERFDLNDFTIKLNLKNGLQLTTPSDFHHMDRAGSKTGVFVLKRAFFYLFNNGVRDFFVESEINLAYRDYGELLHEKHFEPEGYSDYNEMFRSDIITKGNYYKYDFSLSVSKLYNNFSTWGKVLPRSYDPQVAVDCFEYYPNRVIYSLQQQDELKRDNWKAYLANNYKDFGGKVSNIKTLNENGAVILYEDSEPTRFVGVDTLQTQGGTKITIGDGGLFQQNMQSLVNADDILEYGSCQSHRSAVNTPYGLFYISQKIGKIVQYGGGGLNEISRNGLRLWFAEYLPSKLLQAFPDYDLYDNPVEGVGCQTIYDGQYDLVYFCKRDFKPLNPDIKYDNQVKKFYLNCNTLTLQGEGQSLAGIPNSGRCYIELTNPQYFENCSWTISYDPKSKTWISFHDWHPSLTLPAYEHFLTVKGAEFWKHNDRCDLYSNYYSVDYPWEVEFPVTSGNNVTTTRSVEYLLENYKYYNDCQDSFAPLDHNFDRAIIYNNEQISGLLEMQVKPKNNPIALLQYPIVGANSIQIHYSKEENKYRFNQFWDVTRNRFEFAAGAVPMWITEANGYKKRINPTYVNYAKPPLERKKFRHYGNRLFLRKNISGEVKMLLKLFTTKQLISFR